MTEQYDFDTPINRRNTDSIKWSMYPDDVLPMWVADMDFAAPPSALEAIKQRTDHGVFGYGFDLPILRETIAERMLKLYDWTIDPDQILFFPGVVAAFNFLISELSQPGHKVLVQPPIYPPFLSGPGVSSQVPQLAELVPSTDEHILRYEIDFDIFSHAIDPWTKLFLMCNPHNPVGRAFRRDELTRMAEICLENDMWIISDEIHCDLMLDGTSHIPLATLSPDISARTVTLMSTSKTYNLAGLFTGFAIFPTVEMRNQTFGRYFGRIAPPNILGLHAALGAYQGGDSWLQQLQTYLTANRDYLIDYVKTHLPGVKITQPEGTYLAWLDFNTLKLPDNNPYTYFMEVAKVGCNDGRTFGTGGAGFVRLNFACPRVTLTDALERIKASIEAVAG